MVRAIARLDQRLRLLVVIREGDIYRLHVYVQSTVNTSESVTTVLPTYEVQSQDLWLTATNAVDRKRRTTPSRIPENPRDESYRNEELFLIL